MKVYKIEVMLLDFDGIEEEEIKVIIENLKYLHLQVKKMDSREITWHDDHPLNKRETQNDEYNRLFSDEEV